MHGNLKILFLFLTIALFLAPGISLACSKKDQQAFKTPSHDQTFSQQSSAAMPASCDNGACKDKCCHPKPHSYPTEGCSGQCSGNICSSLQYPVLAECKFLYDAIKHEAGYPRSNSVFYYQNPTYSGGFHSIWQPPKIG